MSNFVVFKHAVAKQFAEMQKYNLYRVAVTGDALWDTYLNSFPEGTNNIYRERREHDCSCCKQFIRAVGNVVAIKDGHVISIWDGEVEEPYATVTKALSKLVKSSSIVDLFLHYEKTAGTDKNFEQLVSGEVVQWNHFHINIAAQFVKSKSDIPTILGLQRSTYDVLLRSLREITQESIDTTLELIAQNSLYRGEEHKASVVSFGQLKGRFDASNNKELFVWSILNSVGQAVARMRNTAIGTLLVDLSEGRDLEYAVKSFETKVAPANYKRPTALITKAMIDKAKEELNQLGLTSALERRYASMDDLQVGNILFIDRSIKRKLNGDVFDELTSTVASKPKNLDKIEEIGIDKFLTDVLPKADSIEIMFEGKHKSNLFSLVTAADPTAKNLFKWNNNFSWSYNGDVADSIKERVKQAGGNVTGELCCRLAWFNYDDLDLHMREVDNIYEISFRNKGYQSPSGGRLDVDMNAGSGITREAVENIYYPSISKMRNGTYQLVVNQWCQREAKDVGFQVDIDLLGDVQTFTYDKPVKTRENIVVANIIKDAQGVRIEGVLSGSARSQQVWGVNTNQFHKVKLVTLSPNYWDGGVGNKHFFFVLDGCKNDGEARGFFNEFLSNDLDKHRKVFEVVGSKMRASDTQEQLSGLGFSSTQRNHVIVKVSGSFTRMLKVNF